MHLRRLVLAATGLLALPLSLAGPVHSAVAAPAAPASQCSGDRYFYKKHDDQVKFKRAKGAHSAVSGDPEVTLSISRSRTFTVTGSVNASQSVSVKVAVVTVSAGLGESVSLAYADQSSSSGSWKVPKSYKHGGRLEIGARVHSGYVTKYRERKNCTIYTYPDAALYTNLPENSWHFHHVKLKS